MASAAPGQEPYLKFTDAQRWLAVAVMAFSNFMVVLDLTIANVSVPHIAGDLGTSTDQGTWVITSYAVAEAICVPLTGWLAQRFGVVRVFVTAMLGFAGFSFACGLAPSLMMLVAFRIGQGLCGGPIMPMSQTLIQRVCAPQQRTKAMAIWAMTTTAGPALGPILGGWISDNYSWNWVFFINVPIGIVVSIASWRLVRKVETETQKVPIDRVGLGLLVFWITCLQIMLDIGRDHDWFSDWKIVALAIGGAVGFVVFVIWELTEEHPVVDLRVFRHRGFSAIVVTQAFGFGAFFAGVVVVPQWLQLYEGYTATLAGIVAGAHAYAAMASSQFVARAMGKIDSRIIVCTGCAWMGVTALIRSTWTSTSDFWFLTGTMFIQGFGVAMMFIPLTALSLGSVLPREVPSAAGLQNFVRTVSGAVATSLVLTIWGDGQERARDMLVNRIQPAEAQSALAGIGFNADQARNYISRMVETEASAISMDHTFQVAASLLFLAAALVWIVPAKSARKMSGGPPAGGH